MNQVEDYPRTYLGSRTYGDCTIHRYRVELPEEERKENARGVLKVCAMYQRRLIEEMHVTPEELAYRKEREHEAMALLEADDMDGAIAIYDELDRRLHEKFGANAKNGGCKD